MMLGKGSPNDNLEVESLERPISTKQWFYRKVKGRRIPRIQHSGEEFSPKKTRV